MHREDPAPAPRLREIALAEAEPASERRAWYGRSWALLVGIDDYGGRHPALAQARNDAAGMARLLRTRYRFDEVHTLFDGQATRSEIAWWLKNELPERTGPDDRVVFFFAGHGTTQSTVFGGKRGYLVPADAEAGRYGDYLDMEDVHDACGLIAAKHVLIVLDCCFSGVAAVASRSTPPRSPARLEDAYLDTVTRKRAWQILTAGASDERVADSGRRPGHSAFTGALLNALEGAADQNGDRIITATELAAFITPLVARETDRGDGKGQTPFFNYLAGSEEGDFVFVVPDGAGAAATPAPPVAAGAGATRSAASRAGAGWRGCRSSRCSPRSPPRWRCWWSCAFPRPPRSCASTPRR